MIPRCFTVNISPFFDIAASNSGHVSEQYTVLQCKLGRKNDILQNEYFKKFNYCEKYSILEIFHTLKSRKCNIISVIIF